MLDPWINLSNEVLINVYHTAVNENIGEENIKVIFDEIKRRNLSISKQRPKHIKRLK
ncbi:sporulation histidine kinase inhibitor Sda [Metabacillus litoralis]|uniref:sporulation histidine kinase inhibitor Sda n=1 Tax=Metabacillus litoralis TaxID=152268 RepID=UPI00203E5DB2|nr:sporulation histidine kinase inhibitor Sda [Metabacillus litoralis]MCM3410210.1 sporulation histidine kinase inhibitor Sda [Metabacillus litoralis]